MKVVIEVVPPEQMRYWTVGDYIETPEGQVIIIADQGDERANMLIALHEFVELFLTRQRGIKDEDIMPFDLEWEQKEAKGQTLALEAGDEPGCPYGKEHRFAENLERLFCAELGLTW